MKGRTKKTLWGILTVALAIGATAAATAFGLSRRKKFMGGGKVVGFTRSASTLLNDAVDAWPIDGPSFDIHQAWKGGSRNNAEQLALYQQGRSGVDAASAAAWVVGMPYPGKVTDQTKVVTNSPNANYSGHGHDAARDFNPVDPISGVPIVGVFESLSPDQQQQYQDMQDYFASKGLRVQVKTASGIDWPHVEDPNWDTFPLAS